MSEGFENPIIAGTGALIREQIKSPNYVPGSTGWKVGKDGSAEFANLKARGDIEATTVNVTDPDSSSVRIYDENPGDGAIVELRSATGATSRVRAGASPEIGGNQALVIRGPKNGASPNGESLVLGNGIANLDAEEQVMIETPGQVDVIVGGSVNFWLPSTGDPNIVSLVGSGSNAGYPLRQGGLDELKVRGVGQHFFWTCGGVSVTNSTAHFDVPDTTVNMAPYSIYWVELLLSYDGPVAANARFRWAVSHATVTVERHITALGANSTSNVQGSLLNLRRAAGTSQLVGTTGGVENTFSVYRETAIMANTDGTPHSARVQFGQGVVNATPSVVQNGFLRGVRVA